MATPESESSKAPLKYFLLKVASIKYFYIICIFLCLSLAVIFYLITPKTYEATASISPVENKTSSMLSSSQLFGGIESIQSLTAIENEINNLNSFDLVFNTIANMNFEVSYFREKSKILKRTDELYGQVPFLVTLDKSHIQPIEAKLFINILDASTKRRVKSTKLPSRISVNATSAASPCWWSSHWAAG